MDIPPPIPVPPPAMPPDSPEARRWITIVHLSALAGFLIPSLGQVLGPLVVWLLKKNDVPGLDAAGREVLNFQISWTLWMAVSWLFVFIGWCLILPLAGPIVLLVAWVLVAANGAIKASNGEAVRFPLTIRFL